MLNISEICDNFIGRSAENETTTGSYRREHKYIEYLIRTELGDDPSEEDLNALWQRYCSGDYRLDEFNEDFPVVTMETVKNPAGTVEYEGETYILLHDAERGEHYTAAGEPIDSYDATAVLLGDDIDVLGNCPLYMVVWKVDDDYDPESAADPCDWDEPYEVYLSGTYEVEA